MTFLNYFNEIDIFLLFLLLIGLSGILFNYKNLISTIISIEICLLSLNLSFIVAAAKLDDMTGIIVSLIILTIAAAEAAIGLAIIILYYRVRNNINVKNKYYLGKK